MPWNTKDFAPSIWHKLYVNSLRTVQSAYSRSLHVPWCLIESLYNIPFKYVILSVSKAFDISINNTNHIQHIPDETLGVDVTIILGKDINSFPHISEYISQSK